LSFSLVWFQLPPVSDRGLGASQRTLWPVPLCFVSISPPPPPSQTQPPVPSFAICSHFRVFEFLCLMQGTLSGPPLSSGGFRCRLFSPVGKASPCKARGPPFSPRSLVPSSNSSLSISLAHPIFFSPFPPVFFCFSSFRYFCGPPVLFFFLSSLLLPFFDRGWLVFPPPCPFAFFPFLVFLRTCKPLVDFPFPFLPLHVPRIYTSPLTLFFSVQKLNRFSILHGVCGFEIGGFLPENI